MVPHVYPLNVVSEG